MSRIALEPAGPADLPALATLVAGTPLLQRYGSTPEGALAALAAARAAGDLLLVARAGDGLRAGLAWVMAGRLLTGAGYLRLLVVHEDHRGRGLGARLLEAAETWVRARANQMFLLVTTDNADARRFYERAGYRHVGDLPGLAAPDLDEALYHKPLRPHGERLPG